MDASEIYSKRLNAKEVIFPKQGEFIFPIADGRIKIPGGDQELRTSTLVRRRPIQGEGHIDFLGESEGSLPQPHNSLPVAGEAINDFWSMSGSFMYRHHVEPRVALYSPREESFPIPLKYIDITRTTHTNLDVKLEKRIDDYWNIDGSRDLSDPWTGFTQFTLLEEKAPDGYMWDQILALGPMYRVTLDDLSVGRDLGIGAFFDVAAGVHRRLCDFIHQVVVHRRDEAIRGWRNWIREDPLVHPCRWLRPDLVPPAPFLQCEPHRTPDGSGVLSDPSQIDAEFRKAWLHYFCRSGQRETSLDEFGFEVDGWLPLLPEVHLPRLTGQMLVDVVHREGVSAGGLDGWGWIEFKVLPRSWFDELARVLSKVEDLGVWPNGLLDAYITMVPKTDGDATPLGQRPLSVLHVVYRIWTSARMGQLDDWFKSWVPDSVFSAGGGRGSVVAFQNLFS